MDPFKRYESREKGGKVVPGWINKKVMDLEIIGNVESYSKKDLQEFLDYALDIKDYEWAKEIAERMEKL